MKRKKSIKYSYPKILYFAYGSNVNYRQMKYRCCNCKYIQKVVCSDYNFTINKRGVATILNKKGEKTFGILWLLSQKNLKNLDSYEGLKQKRYYRNYVKINLKGKSLNAITYFSTEVKKGKPKKNYIKLILNGIKHFKGNPKWRNEIKKWI